MFERIILPVNLNLCEIAINCKTAKKKKIEPVSTRFYFFAVFAVLQNCKKNRTCFNKSRRTTVLTETMGKIFVLKISSGTNRRALSFCLFVFVSIWEGVCIKTSFETEVKLKSLGDNLFGCCAWYAWKILTRNFLRSTRSDISCCEKRFF